MDIRVARALSVLLPNSESAQSDVDWLLSRRVNMSYGSLRFYDDRELSISQYEGFVEDLIRRQSGEPVAYILGDQGFWSLDLRVNPSTLIPRPDTEALVELVLSRFSSTPLDLLDLGTGTGAIALALATERPAWRIVAVDKMAESVELAKDNAVRNGISTVQVFESDWYEAITATFDVIVSNPPYIVPGDKHLEQGDVRFEPLSALVAADNGLADIKKIIKGALSHLNRPGWLFIEHGFDQAESVRQEFLNAGFVHVDTGKDLAGNDRVSFGQLKL